MNLLNRRFFDISVIVAGIANEPTANPVAGTQYIVGANPTGAFAGATTNSIARYDGTEWKFTAPKNGELEVLNSLTGEFLKWNGTTWAVALTINRNSSTAPVLAVVPTGITLPASASAGDSFFKTDDAKLYTATAADTWDSGTATANGSRYASSTDFKIYTSDGSAATGETLNEDGFFFNKENNSLYVYNGSTLIKIGGSSDASEASVTEVHTLTATEVTVKSFTLTNTIKTGHENNVLIFVSGVAQAVGTDFTASGNAISWANKGLDTIGLMAGDTFIVHYVKA